MLGCGVCAGKDCLLSFIAIVLIFMIRVQKFSCRATEPLLCSILSSKSICHDVANENMPKIIHPAVI